MKTMNLQIKRLRTAINNWLDKLGERWRSLSVRQQHRYILLVFSGYAILTIGVMLKVCYDVLQGGEQMSIEHIESPVAKKKTSGTTVQDSISTILKKKMHESK
jgi:hypothetical protein